MIRSFVYAPSVEIAIERLEALAGGPIGAVPGVSGAAIELVGGYDPDAAVQRFCVTIPDSIDAARVLALFDEFTIEG